MPRTLPLDHMVMYRLYSAWAQASPVYVRMSEGRFGITRREWRVLVAAISHESASTTQLAETAHLDLARTSRTVRSLHEKGWLTRHPGTTDARISQVRVTDSGRKLYARIMPEIARLNSILTCDLSEEELSTLLKLLRTIEARGSKMAQDNLIKEKTCRSLGGTRRVLRQTPR